MLSEMETNKRESNEITCYSSRDKSQLIVEGKRIVLRTKWVFTERSMNLRVLKVKGNVPHL